MITGRYRTNYGLILEIAGDLGFLGGPVAEEEGEGESFLDALFEEEGAPGMSQAQMVKIEGGAEMAETTHFLTSRGIPVCAHVGLTPQSVHQLGGYRVQGKDDAGAAKLKADALAQQEAGATLMVLEAIPATLSAEVSAMLSLVTIGIGASKECAGQVLVLHDMLDIAPGRKARFVKNFMTGQPSVAAAIAAYVTAVKDGSFPAPEHCY